MLCEFVGGKRKKKIRAMERCGWPQQQWPNKREIKRYILSSSPSQPWLNIFGARVIYYIWVLSGVERARSTTQLCCEVAKWAWSSGHEQQRTNEQARGGWPAKWRWARSTSTARWHQWQHSRTHRCTCTGTAITNAATHPHVRNEREACSTRCGQVVQPEIQKVPRHIESCGTCMKH